MTATRMISSGSRFKTARNMRAHDASMRVSRFEIGSMSLDRLRRPWALRVQSLAIVELTDLGSEHVHDHVAGIDQHPVAIGQALDMDVLDTGFLEALRDVLRDRANVPVGPARGDDHVVGVCRFAAKVDGDGL